MAPQPGHYYTRKQETCYMDRFRILLQRYERKTASEQEKEELFSLVRTGRYDDFLGDEITASLNEELEVQDAAEEEQRMNRLYDRKIADSIQADKVNIRATKVLRIRSWLVAAAVITAAVFGFQWLIKSQPDHRSLTAGKQMNASATEEKQLVKFSEKQLIHLPDGSKVLLNKGSELTYHQANFGKAFREVTLTGEAFFDIEHDPSKPFKVYTGKVITTVLGTAFNISSLPGTQQVKISVTRGKVKVGDETRTYDMITPDQEMMVNTLSYQFTKQNVSAKVSTAWTDQFLILDDVTMLQAAARISEKFHVKVKLANPDIGNCHISASFFDGESLAHVLDVVSVVNQITYTIESDGTVVLDGSASCK